jgi:hypothetical protein
LIIAADHEDGHDSFACHRVTLFVRVTEREDPVELARQEIEFHREANSVLTDDERLSVQLHVEFEPAESDTPE